MSSAAAAAAACPLRHAQIRALLRDAFSERGLRAQEHVVASVVDRFIERIGTESRGSGGQCKAIEVTEWFNILTFEVIVELAFGRSFGSIEKGELHPWGAFVMASMREFAYIDAMVRFPVLGSIFAIFNPFWILKLVKGAHEYRRLAVDMMQKRLSSGTDRCDFGTRILNPKIRESYNLSDLQLAAHGSDFVIAGSETAATALATAMWFVGKSPKLMKRLREEVRSSYSSYEQIDGQTAAALPLLHAVCLEALRILPPLPLGLPRVVPAGGAVVDGHFIPAGTIVSTNPVAACLSPNNFSDPTSFDPDRWLDGCSDVKSASQPFSAGSRACIGRNLAWMEMHTALVKLHFRYDVVVEPIGGLDWLRDCKMWLLWAKPPYCCTLVEQ